VYYCFRRVASTGVQYRPHSHGPDWVDTPDCDCTPQMPPGPAEWGFNLCWRPLAGVSTAGVGDTRYWTGRPETARRTAKLASLVERLAGHGGSIRGYMLRTWTFVQDG
jgi:hypothetical protein